MANRVMSRSLAFGITFLNSSLGSFDFPSVITSNNFWELLRIPTFSENISSLRGNERAINSNCLTSYHNRTHVCYNYGYTHSTKRIAEGVYVSPCAWVTSFISWSGSRFTAKFSKWKTADTLVENLATATWDTETIWIWHHSDTKNKGWNFL